MIQRSINFITVPEVILEMGLEPTNELDWRVGSMMADWYERNFGAPPLKDNRRKTNGGGSHCFALYPELFRTHIQGFVKMCQTEQARQPGLFDNHWEIELENQA